MWKVVTSSNLNPLFKLFFYLLISTNNNLSLKIYFENIVVMLLNFDFSFLVLFSFLSLVFFFIHTFFFSFLFSCFFSSTHEHLPPISIFTLCLTFCFSSYLQNISPFTFSLSFSFSYTHTHTNFSPSISHKQILFHACINHWKRTKIRVLPTSKDMQLNHHIDQISVLHVFFFWF